MHCVVLCCVALRCVALRCVALRCVALRCVALCCVVLYCGVLYCTVLYCTVLYCIYCIVLYCIVLYCSCVVLFIDVGEDSPFLESMGHSLVRLCTYFGYFQPNKMSAGVHLITVELHYVCCSV